MKIAENVFLVPGIVANSYIIRGADGLMVVDAALPNNSAKILKYIQSLGYQPGDVKQIIITHADIDHVGSLEALRAATGASVWTSQHEADAIRGGKPSRELQPRGIQKVLVGLMSRLFRAKPSQVERILAGGEELPALGGLRVLNTPGHTPGHISLWSPSTGLLFSGDSILIDAQRFRPSQGMNNWNTEKSEESYRLQAALHPSAVLGGHGWTDQEVEKKFKGE